MHLRDVKLLTFFVIFGCIKNSSEQKEDPNGLLIWRKGPITNPTTTTQRTAMSDTLMNIVNSQLIANAHRDVPSYVLINTPDHDSMMNVVNNVQNVFGGQVLDSNGKQFNRTIVDLELENDTTTGNVELDECVNAFISEIKETLGSVADLSISKKNLKKQCEDKIHTTARDALNKDKSRQSDFPPGFFPSRHDILGLTTTTSSPLESLSDEQQEIISRLPQGMQNVVSSIVMAVQASSTTAPPQHPPPFLPLYQPYPYYPPVVYPSANVGNQQSVPISNVLDQLRRTTLTSTPSTTESTTQPTSTTSTRPPTTATRRTIQLNRPPNLTGDTNFQLPPNRMFSNRLGDAEGTNSDVDRNQGLLSLVRDASQMGNGEPSNSPNSNFRPNRNSQMGSPVVNVIMPDQQGSPLADDQPALTDLIPFIEPEISTTTLRPMNRQEANSLVRSLFGSPIMLFMGVVFAISAAYLVIAMEQQDSQQAFQQAQLAAAFGKR